MNFPLSTFWRQSRIRHVRLCHRRQRQTCRIRLCR